MNFSKENLKVIRDSTESQLNSESEPSIGDVVDYMETIIELCDYIISLDDKINNKNS